MKFFPAAIIVLSALLLSLDSYAADIAASTTRPVIFVCGDSTANNNAKDRTGKQMEGWGTPLDQFFDPAKAVVNNVAHAGQSSLTYYEGDWPRVLPQIHAGDLVLIVFGINDGSTPNGIGPETRPGQNFRTRAADTQHTYGWYMAKMATDAQEKGARPFFLTVTARDIWTNPKARYRDATPITTLPTDYNPADDKIERGTSRGAYTQWTKDLGAQMHIPVFDLTNYCADMYEKMGREEVSKLYSDHNHTYAPGAEIVAAAVVSGIKALNGSPFVDLLSEKGKAVPAADAKYINDNLPGTTPANVGN